MQQRTAAALARLPSWQNYTPARLLSSSRACTRAAAEPDVAASENVGSHMAPHAPEVIKAAKERELKGKGRPGGIPGLDGWEEELASVSEAYVKADQYAQDIPLEELQKLSVRDGAAQAEQAMNSTTGPTVGVNVSSKMEEDQQRSCNNPSA